MNIQEILKIRNGATFYRADMHIHSHGSSHDVKDLTMTPEEIVKTALIEKIDVIALTDHNDIRNVQRALVAAQNTNLFVVPGIELSTLQGHLLCYLPTLELLEKFYGRINIVDRNLPTSRCQNAILDCLNILKELGGFSVLAHVEVASGFEFENPGNSPHKIDILCHDCLLGIELKKADSTVYYSPSDSDSGRRNIGQERIKRLSLGSNQCLARVLNSDAHTLNSLGKNANGNKKITRIKMDNPSFDAIKLAFEDSDARIRIEDQIPNSIPRIVGLQLDGGFLDGQKIHLSPNLNCIIGGRGTGKSTTFEAIKCLVGKPSDSGVIDSEVWPGKIYLGWCDQAEQYHILSRQLGGSIMNISDPTHGPCSFHIESYSQGETERISKDAQDNPIALLSYLDRFISLDDFEKEEIEVRNSLLAIQTEIEKAEENVNKIPQYEQSLKITQQQLEALEKVKAKELIELTRKLAQERGIRDQVSSKIASLKIEIENTSAKSLLKEIKNLAVPANLTIGKDELQKIIDKADEFESELSTSQNTAKADFNTLSSYVQTEISSWKAKENKTLSAIEEKKKELQAKNISFDLMYIQKLANDEAQGKVNLANLNMWVPHLKNQKKLYSDTLKKRWEIREKIAMTRSAFAKDASNTLKSVLTDLTVSLKYLHSSYSPAAEEQIKIALSWRTTQVQRANLLVTQLSVPRLLQAVETNDHLAIMSVMTPEGTPVFDKASAENIIIQLSLPRHKFILDRCEVFDLPNLIVTRQVRDATGKISFPQRDFSKLSLGQQQSVLLSLMLSSKSNSPLIIDQPEDNLDGEFIYHSLVPVLRLAKERRQIIIVTHNANIAVLGDAEQIIVLKSTNDKSMIVSHGSIDEPVTRDKACSILEGAREAFQRRSKIYGVK